MKDFDESEFWFRRGQIEYVLGRILTGAELDMVPTFKDITPLQREVIKQLRTRQLVCCAMYIHIITGHRFGLREITEYMDEFV